MDMDDFSDFIDQDTLFDDNIDNQIDGDIEEDEIIITEEKDIYNNKEREEKITLPIMTIYEKVNVISQRIKQLDNNYKTTLPEEVKESNINKSFDIAMLEFNKKKLPNLYIIRPFPDGSYEKWTIDEFEEFP
jgi:DNA-directed RNA polymerase subunit K/omega|tara:strand:- start:133 stop:528 length:396 start_codon:yes stop_codon:yes gene_type:complete